MVNYQPKMLDIGKDNIHIRKNASNLVQTPKPIAQKMF